MYKINVTTQFAGAHLLKGYPGDCKNLHGHNWRVRVQLQTENLDEMGMAIDFSLVKQHLNSIISKFDHKFLNDLPQFTQQNPTSENIAKIIFTELEILLNTDNIIITEVEVWESDSSSTIYSK